MKKYTLLFACLLGALFATKSSAVEFYVSPSGDDSNPGTRQRPLKTFAAARDRVRTVQEDGDITVYFREGFYYFTRPVKLTIEDSGSENRRIKYCAYPGEKPVFTSGVRVTGWGKITSGDPAYKSLPKNAKANCYVADIPDAIKNNRGTDGLFRILIDRQNDYLERGIFSIAGQILTHWTSEYSDVVENAKYYSPEMKKICDVKVDLAGLANAPEAMDLFTWMSDWNTSMVPIKSIEKTQEGSRIRTRVAGSYKLAGTAREYHENVDFVDSALVNAIEGIDGPGKWAVNHKAGKIYLWPPKNSKLEKNIYAPTLYELISVHGDMPAGKKAWFSKKPVKPVEYVSFEGITFTECGFKMWTDRTPMAQHGWAVCDYDNAMLRFRGVKNCIVTNCTFEKSGGVGVRFDLYAQNNKVEGCKFENLGMEAVHFGGYGGGTRDENGHNAVINNEIGFPGRIKSDVHCITVWQSGFNKIENNYIHDTPYTPILLAGPRFRTYIKYVDDNIPWKEDFYLREAAWEMIRWDEIPEIATFTMTLRGDEGRMHLSHEPHADHPQHPRPWPHAKLDYHPAPYRFTQGNVVQFNTFERASMGAFGEVIYISGTTEPGERNVFTDNYICNCRNAVKPLIWVLYVDGYGRGIEIQRNIVYNSEVIYVGFNNSYWNTYNGWTWKDFSFAASTPPQLPTANVFVDDDIGELINREALGTIVADCRTEQKDIHDPSVKYLEDYKTILANLNQDKFPYPKGRLPGRKKVTKIIRDVIGDLAHGAEKHYEPTWKSLKRHSTPEWLSDAKFGIYTHWQPRSRNPEEFKAEKFDAEAWARLFKKAGAQFAGPVAEHWRGFPMWDSKYTDWDAADWGPKRDIVGELQKAITKRGMKFFVSFHRPNARQEEEMGTKVREVIEKYRPDLVWFDVSLGGTLDARNWGRYVGGKNIYGKDNLLLAKEPGLPSGGVTESVRKEFIAYYYNKEIEWGKGVEVLYKEYDLPPGVGMRDIENGRLGELPYDEWINDVDIAHPTTWFYHGEDITFHSANTLIDELVDMVSKNGRLLLNVPPRPDGTFPPKAVELLGEMGEWLEVNGEAIYDTTAWVVYGEGPTEFKETPLNHYANEKDFDFGRLEELMESGRILSGHYTQEFPVEYKPEDIRFTVKGDFLYAICLGWPGDEVTIESLGSRAALKSGEIKKVQMLGADEELEWEHAEKGLIIKTPRKKPCKYAYAFKIIRK